MELMHIGVPTAKERPGEKYKDALKVYLSGPDDNDFHFEYFRYVEGSPMPELVQKSIHVAMKVDNLAAALADCDQVLVEPMRGTGRTLAFGMKDGVVLEFIEYDK